jgi:hypothetical protein
MICPRCKREHPGEETSPGAISSTHRNCAPATRHTKTAAAAASSEAVEPTRKKRKSSEQP